MTNIERRTQGTHFLSTAVWAIAAGLFISTPAAAQVTCETESGECTYEISSTSDVSCVCVDGSSEEMVGASMPEDTLEGEVDGYCLRTLEAVCDGNVGSLESSADCEDEVASCTAAVGVDYLFVSCQCNFVGPDGATGLETDGAPIIGRELSETELMETCESVLEDSRATCGIPDAESSESDAGDSGDSETGDGGAGNESAGCSLSPRGSASSRLFELMLRLLWE